MLQHVVQHRVFRTLDVELQQIDPRVAQRLAEGVEAPDRERHAPGARVVAGKAGVVRGRGAGAELRGSIVRRHAHGVEHEAGGKALRADPFDGHGRRVEGMDLDAEAVDQRQVEVDLGAHTHRVDHAAAAQRRRDDRPGAELLDAAADIPEVPGLLSDELTDAPLDEPNRGSCFDLAPRLPNRLNRLNRLNQLN
ncbi:MAG TPA: hypothetical protein VFJ16_29000 [Longimicrobium sp.]|nr:hypothetical protein [Longimicrobium sp.]